MTTIALKSFSGERPCVPPRALSDANAQQAVNCDLTHGDLRPMRQGALFKTFSHTVRGLYTADGVTFFTWSEEVQALRSPVLEDAHQRVYYTSASQGLRVTPSAPTILGGAPATSFKVGVPAPASAPVLTAVDRGALRGYASAVVTARAWWESGGTRYGEADVALTQTSLLRGYTFTPPAQPAGTPAGAVLNAAATLTGDGERVFSLNIAAGASPASTDALPGGVEVSLTSAGALTLSWGVWETRAYVFTARNIWGEESAPSPAAVVDVTYLQDVQVDVAPPSFVGYQALLDLRIYRTFGTSTSYVVVNATAQTSTRYLDATWKASDMGAALYSLDFEAPPDGLFGLTAMPGGFFAAFQANSNVVCFSEPNRPHSWQYALTFPENIRGIRMGAQALVVTTAAGCFLVMGAHPKSLQRTQLPVPQAGRSHRSMARVDGAVAFASSDGVVLVQGSAASISTSQAFFTREDWRNRYDGVLDDMRFECHDGKLIGVSTTQAKGLVFELDEAQGVLTQWAERVDATFYLPATDKLYYSVGTDLYAFRDGGTFYTYDWWSKDFDLPAPMSFGAAWLRGAGSVTVTIYANGAPWHTFNASGSGYFRLPAGMRALRYSVRLQGTAQVDEFVLAQSMGELRNV